jgi:RHH-type proline utilization regulon transcriptional repressor/proline dehydrogenase/delta 1-pyrroline-5-carboxylate dehydrogenase
VNLDMEEYGDLDLTLDLFTELLDERPELSAGVVLQAYLPDTFPALRRLTQWCAARDEAGGTPVKLRLVKGANLAMERVAAELHGWVQAPYATKHETDANYKRCIDWVLHADRLRGLRIGVASHNLFDVAWAHELSIARGVADRVAFEMLQGMSPVSAAAVLRATGDMLLYTPTVARDDFDVAISYLFRRLEENAAEDNFLRALFALRPGSPEFRAEEKRFRDALAARYEVAERPRRSSERLTDPATFANEPDCDPATFANEPDCDPATFANEPNSDPALPETRSWSRAVAAGLPRVAEAPLVSEAEEVSRHYSRVREGAAAWRARSGRERAGVLREVAALLAKHRGPLITTMMDEASKTFPEADAEVSEAIDFARYYATQALTLDDPKFSPFGVVAVVPPWNFPVAIPAGGVFAALAAGNAAVLKPAPETPACAELLAEICGDGGIPREVLALLRTPDNSAGRRVVEEADAVILTGSWETAQLFRSWKPELRLFAETSGKNAIIVTPHADLDQAAHDVVRSAFGHAGQKCSAASLAILVGEVFHSARFRRQLQDATESLVVGTTDDLATELPALIRPPEGALLRALNDGAAGWLVRPQVSETDPRLWSPGILDAVAAGSWFHRTECFGPVLGIMAADDLDHAIELQNATPFGLTGGIESLDPHEVDHWLARVEVGNAYVNREITGAIVRRQPFGGWKRSSVGPGAKAGGPNYVAQFGTFLDDEVPAQRGTPSEEILDLQRMLVRNLTTDDGAWLQAAAEHDAYCWEHEYGIEHDPSALRVEANLLRYRPHPDVAVRIEADAALRDAARTLIAAHRSGAGLDLSAAPGFAWGSNGSLGFQEESLEELIDRLGAGARLRIVGALSIDARRRAQSREIEVFDNPVAGSGRRELPLYLREQTVSRTLHRYGNLLSEAAGRRALPA